MTRGKLFKRIVKVGQPLTVWGGNYIYTGTVAEVGEDYVILDPAGVVYETGDFRNKVWKDAHALPVPQVVFFANVESMGAMTMRMPKPAPLGKDKWKA